ncbi:MAG: DUF1343 domain-containing protein, partial [Bacteroidota bacterium]|nr:DUF1343 domain-containing protein [Bacteroidota bacterium]
MPGLLKTKLLFCLAICLMAVAPHHEIVVGAARTSVYQPLLKGKSVAIVGNHTSMVGKTHLL